MITISDLSLREKYITLFFSLMPLFNYFGRALFYIHFFISLIIMAFFCEFSLKRIKSIGVILYSIIFYFITTILVNLYPTRYSDLNALNKQLTVFFMVIVVCYVSRYLFIVSVNSVKNRKYALFSISMSLFFPAVIVLLSYGLEMNLVESLKNMQFVPYEHAFYHAKQAYLSIGCCFLLYIYSKNKSLLNLLVMLTFFGATLASSGRTAIVTVFVSSISYLLLATFGQRRVWHYALVLLLATAALFSVSYISSGDPLAVFSIHTSARVDGAFKYIEYVSTNSPLWGLGLDAGNFLREQGVIPYGSPHNIFLDAYVTLGAVGLFVFLLFLVFIVIVVSRLCLRANDPQQAALLISTFVAILLAGQMYLSIWSKHNMMLIFFYMYLAASYLTHREQ